MHCFQLFYAVPGPPQNVHFLGNTTVVFWQAPKVPNGNITGYDIRISTTSGQTISVITVSGVLYYGIPRPNDVSMAQIEVSSKTMINYNYFKC